MVGNKWMAAVAFLGLCGDAQANEERPVGLYPIVAAIVSHCKLPSAGRGGAKPEAMGADGTYIDLQIGKDFEWRALTLAPAPTTAWDASGAALLGAAMA